MIKISQTTLCYSALLLIHAFSQTINKSMINETLQKLNKPLVCTRTGIEDFFTTTFNHRSYGQYFLPSSFVHLIDFFNYGANTKSPYSYYATTCDLFQVRMKESSWINPYALAQLIKTITEKLKSLCEVSLLQTSSFGKIRGKLQKTFLQESLQLNNNPDYILDALTHDIIATLHSNDELHENITQLQESVTRLIESALDKLIWSPHEQEQTWECCKFLADQLFLLSEYNIIPNNKSLNRCYWSLIYRYCYFLETVGDKLSLETYQKIRTDLQQGNLALLALSSYDRQRTGKKERLEAALFEGEIRIRADATAPYYAPAISEISA